MRSPAIVFSVVAVSALSPSVLGSPLPVHSTVPSTLEHRRSNTVTARGLGFLNDIFARADNPAAAQTSKPKVATVMGYTVGYVFPSPLRSTHANPAQRARLPRVLEERRRHIQRRIRVSPHALSNSTFN